MYMRGYASSLLYTGGARRRPVKRVRPCFSFSIRASIAIHISRGWFLRSRGAYISGIDKRAWFVRRPYGSDGTRCRLPCALRLEFPLVCGPRRTLNSNE